MNIINWKEIVTECGGYKAGFVTIFRKYEGQATDERDAYGRAVKVTQKSFARHVGVAEQTFRNWVRYAEMDPKLGPISTPKDRTAASHAYVAKNLAKKSPSALVDAIEQAGPTAVDQVFYDLKQRRTGHGPLPPKPTKAEAKGKKAKAAAAGAAVESGITRSLLPIIPAQLDEISEEVEGAIAQNVMTAELLEAIEEAAQRLLNTVQAGKVFVS